MTDKKFRKLDEFKDLLPTWFAQNFSDRKIAKLCGVSHVYIGQYRKQHYSPSQSEQNICIVDTGTTSKDDLLVIRKSAIDGASKTTDACKLKHFTDIIMKIDTAIVETHIKSDLESKVKMWTLDELRANLRDVTIDIAYYEHFGKIHFDDITGNEPTLEQFRKNAKSYLDSCVINVIQNKMPASFARKE